MRGQAARRAARAESSAKKKRNVSRYLIFVYIIHLSFRA